MADPKNSFRPIVGIDLGTTNSAVSYIKKGKPEIITTETGDSLIPSVVLLDPNGKLVIGEDARAALIAMPERTKAAVKRQMGSSEKITLADQEYLPEEVAAMILSEIKRLVDQQLGEGEKEAVITVPAYFTDEQRRATKRAGELAGFVVERIINEPTAAALAFGLEHLNENRHLLVYDLGGGTFDVSIVEVMDGILEVKASAGNSQLGGEDFDWLLVDWLAENIMDKHGIDPRKEARARAILKEEAESVKKQLSDKQEVDVSLPVVMMKEDQPIGLYTSITRETFVSMIEPLIGETIEKAKAALQDAALSVQDIDEVLLVGGSTRIPYVHEQIRESLGKEPLHGVHPDEAVALGAAVQAGIKAGTLGGAGLIVTDVAPFSMGVAVARESFNGTMRPGAFQPIIPRNTTIPVTRTETFHPTSDFQTTVNIEVYQGENDWVEDNHFLNEFQLEGLPAAPMRENTVDITFRYNLNGILEVTAKSNLSGEAVTVTIQDSLDRSSEEAFAESVKRLKSIQERRMEQVDEEELESYLAEELPEEGELPSAIHALEEEAKSLIARCSKMLEDELTNYTDQLEESIDQLQWAILSTNREQLKAAIEHATDLLIDIELS